MRASLLPIARSLRHLLAASLCVAAAGCDRGAHPGQVGRPAPAIQLADGARTLSLEQFRGKVVVLNFWASWCPPCLEEFPSLEQLQRQMPGIVVLAVSFDEDPAAYREYLVDNHIGLHTVLDTTQRSNLAYGTTRPPETFILDRQGVLRRKFIGPQDWVSPEITGYLKQL
ncbi:MAG TPA: TlpA disulfide reductase family protein [Acidobacteriaceae bacterium]